MSHMADLHCLCFSRTLLYQKKFILYHLSWFLHGYITTIRDLWKKILLHGSSIFCIIK
jgi:hypothetical protein